MGYTTDFFGQFDLDKKLDDDTHQLLTELSSTRRMARDVGPEYGVEGEFYTKGKGHMGQDSDDNIIDNNTPPATQPGLWCQWTPTDDGMYIEWDGGEKFYNYVKWIEYIIERILAPRGYSLSGSVEWYGEDQGDVGVITIENNEVIVKYGKTLYIKPEGNELFKLFEKIVETNDPRDIMAIKALLQNYIDSNLKEVIQDAILE